MNRWSFAAVRQLIAGIGGVTLAAFATAALCPAANRHHEHSAWPSGVGS